MEDFTEISLWGRERLAFLRRFLPFDRGVPSHDTLNDIVNAIDGETFKTCFSSWVETLKDAEPDIIAIDGKTSRRAHARAKGISPLHMVSAWASRQRLVLGQEATAEKSNEIRAIPLLLQRLELKGALVTIDAIGAQIDIAATVIERGGDYLFALKGNRPELHAEVEAYFADPANTGSCERHETIDGDHGRIERRMCIAAHDVDWLKSDRRLPGERTFPQLAAIVCVRSEIEREGRLQSATRYFLSLGPARRQGLRQRRPRALGRREPAPLGARCRLPRRPRSPANWLRRAQYGHRQAHGDEPAATSKG
jgi:predicted transposase YbfD/YdcC